MTTTNNHSAQAEATKAIGSQALPYAFFEGQIVPIEAAKVSIMTETLQYGIGAFGGIRGYYDKDSEHISLFRVEDHFERFLTSVHIFGTTLAYSQSQLKQIALDLMVKNKPQTDCYFRMFAYASGHGLTPLVPAQFEFGMYVIALGNYIPTTTGLAVAVSTWRRVSDNAIPSRGKVIGAYANSALARREAADRGCGEAIMLTEEGHVAEGSAENIFLVRDGVLVTPSKADNILEGITRRTILQLAEDMNIPIEVRSIDRTELYAAQEMFFTGTAAQVAWIKSVDGRIVGTGNEGPITTQLQNAFFEIVKGKNSKYQNWCTKISVA